MGTGSLQKGFALRDAVKQLREETGLDTMETYPPEGAPIPTGAPPALG